ncbi:MAG: hypothetical protein LJE67_13275 [Salaquimonas sp.]|jgi:hypothetical protein|nr:hypothetical protein [Salaquimonas sp.]
MARKITTKNLFKPAPSKGESKAQITDRAVKQITDIEVEKRNAKTERLRKARLAQEAPSSATVSGGKRAAR